MRYCPERVDALSAGVLEQLSALHRRLRAVVEGTDEAVLNSPPREGENSIAVLVTHALGSEMGWLHRAAGIPFKRDRDGEFRARSSRETLRGLLDKAAARMPELVQAAVDARLVTPRELDSGRVTVGYCLAHALSHTAEHVGHAELTRNLIGA